MVGEVLQPSHMLPRSTFHGFPCRHVAIHWNSHRTALTRCLRWKLTSHRSILQE